MDSFWERKSPDRRSERDFRDAKMFANRPTIYEVPGGHFSVEKKPTFRSGLDVRVTYLPGQAKDCPAVKKVSAGHFQAEKSPNLVVRA